VPAAQRSAVYPVFAPIFHWWSSDNIVRDFEMDKEVRHNDVKPGSKRAVVRDF